MLDTNCTFCKIISKEIPSKIISETKEILVIEDKVPKAPFHYLIVPKKHIANIHSLHEEDKELVWSMIKMIQQLAENLPEPKAFNLISNNGEEAGQEIFHLHWHFLAGKNLYDGDFKL